MKAHALYIPLAMIENDVLRGYATYLLAHSHPDFWNSPSSSTGKHHPDQHNRRGEVIVGLEVGGLIAHTWHVLAVAFESMRRYGCSTKLGRDDLQRWARTRDCLAFACILHDWAKNGDPTRGEWGRHTTSDHGEVAARVISGPMFDRFLIAFPEVHGDAEVDLRGMVDEASHAIQHHYGIWGRDHLKPSSSELTDLDRMLSEGDYFCTRRFLGEFDGNRIMASLRELCPKALPGCQSQVIPLTPEPEVTEAPVQPIDTSEFMW